MAKDSDRNPFSRAISAQQDGRVDAVEAAAADLRRKQTDEQLRQPENQAESAETDPPAAVQDNADDSRQAGSEFGLGGSGFVSAKDRVSSGIDDSSGDPAPSVAKDPSERIAEGRGDIPQFNIDGVSTQDALNAASGADNTDVGGLAGADPRSFVEDAKADRNPLNDPQIAASMAFADAAGNTAVTNPYSVAQGSDDLARAVAEVYGAPSKDPDAGKSTDVELLSKGKAGAVTGDAAYWDDEKGEVVYADKVTEAAKKDAAEKTTTVRDHNRTTDGDEKSTGTGLLGMIGEFFAERSYQDEWGETEKKAAELHAARQAKEADGGGGTAGGGVKLVDPDSDRQPPTAEEIAFIQATKDALGIRRIPGDIDPGENDGTQTSGPVNSELAAGIVESRSNESLVGNPGGAGGQNAPASSPGQGTPGFTGSRKGGDIDFEDGSGFVGGVRTEGPQDVDFGVGSEPLVGLDRGDDDDEGDEDDEDEDDEEGSAG